MDEKYAFENFKKDRFKVSKNAADCDEIARWTQKSINHLYDTKSRAEGSAETYIFINEFYGGYKECDFANLTPNELEPLRNAAAQRDKIQQWKQNTQSVYNNVLSSHEIGVISSTTTGLTGIALIKHMEAEESVITKHQHDLIDSYRQHIDFKKDIEYIRQCLMEEYSDFLKDFDRLIKIYESSTLDNTKYMEIMAGRSAFFYKLFGPEGQVHASSPSNKPEQIKRFILGDRTEYIQEVEDLKEEAKSLWDKISNEKSPSAKKGNIEADDLKLIFGELIEIVAKIFSLRKIYHKHIQQ